MPGEPICAFAPGRVNLIGEHTDYNRGLALPFAIAEGVTACAQERTRAAHAEPTIEALAVDLDARDEFPLHDPQPAAGWRAFVRGVVAELGAAGARLPAARIWIQGDVPLGAGLSSSAALEVALCLSLESLARGSTPLQIGDRLAVAELCARVEHRWVGAQTGMLDQLASLFGETGHAICIDFLTLELRPVPLVLGGWRLLVLDSGERHDLARSSYNERREECARACELLGVASLRELAPAQLDALPEPLRRRATHVLTENERVRAAVSALRGGRIADLGPLLDQSHTSLRDLYEVSSAALDAAVARLHQAGAAGARMIGGGFGGSVLGLFAPGTEAPADARVVTPGPGAHLIDR